MTPGSQPTPEPVFPFDPDEPLQRTPELTLRLRSDGSTVVQDHGSVFGPHTLRILEAFAVPTTFRDAMVALQSSAQGAQDWADLGNTIRALHSLGVLDSVREIDRTVMDRVGFDAPGQHINMLNDRQRTGAYLKAIPEVVRSGDVVVEIGAGSGILAMAAARAGARHVYAIESGSIGRAAEAAFQANGLADRITLVPGLSSHVALPEPADVLVSEIIGNEPLQERVLESTQDAIRRFLVPEARFLPQRLRIWVAPVRIPQPIVAGYLFTAMARARWSNWYGMDFEPLERANPPSSVRIFVRPAIPRDWIHVADAALLTEIELASGHPAKLECEANVFASRRETISGIVTWFDLGLSPSIELSTDPSRVDAESSWRLPVWILSQPLQVEPGQQITLRYAYPASVSQRLTIST